MNAFTSKKAIIAILSVSSIVLAGTIKDLRTHAIKKEELAEVEQDVVAIERNVASEASSKVAQIYLPKNVENEQKINTLWEITRIVGADEKITYDKHANPEDAKKKITVNFELIGTSLIKVNDDAKLVYHVSLLSEFGTIALFKKMGNGFEILEAKRVSQPVNNKDLVVSDEVELVLERALNQSKSNKVLTGNDVSGQVFLSAKAINGLEVELRNENGESQNIQIDHAEIQGGGAFKAEVNGEEVSGVVFNNGKDGYRISFVTGPLAGAMLNFTTKEQAEKIEENERDQLPQEEAAPSPEEVKVATEQVIEERKEVANNVESMEPVVLTAEEVKETAQQNGFAF